MEFHMTTSGQPIRDKFGRNIPITSDIFDINSRVQPATISTLDFDKVNTIDDIKAVLAALDISWKNTIPKSIIHLLKVENERG